VECAAIATEQLGSVFDVQAGGSDLVFPHHEMSASHTRVAYADQPAPVFARVYAHAGMVGLGGEKMSKSLGNLVFVSRLVADGEDPMAVRLALLAHHYRDDWEWTEPGLAAARTRLTRWRTATGTPPPATGTTPPATGTTPPAAPPAPAAPAAPPASPTPPAAGASSAPAAPSNPPASPAPPAPGVSSAESVLARVRERLADDLDAPGALTVVDRWADAAIADPAAVSPADRQLVRDLTDALLGVAL
jgi:L-cysteine:1D-myo-inositol 2-amino-2-deoxy-alpha-D-glucopyranoside ligase